MMDGMQLEKGLKRLALAAGCVVAALIALAFALGAML